MKAYSKDLREHVLRAVDQGHPRAEIVRLFGVSLASIKRYLKQRRETGELSPKAIPGRPSKKYAALEAGLVAQLKAHPDSTLEAHCQLWESTHGMWVDHTTMIASLSLAGMGAAMILEGSANATAFEIYVEQLLLPSLQAGQIVVMDNLRAHKGERVRQAIEAKGCQVLFLPGYSPDFSPIEETFSKLKTDLRRAGARTREALEEAICQALLTVTAQDARGWFSHCGYVPVEGSKQ